MVVCQDLFYLLFLLTSALSVCGEKNNYLKLDDDVESDLSCGKSGFVLIATIDGNLTSIDFDTGQKCWTLFLDKEAFFSSNLYNLEVWENGTQFWLIPSLDGVLFRYDKVKLEALPFSAEVFLSQSAALDQSTSVTGGKFKVVYGIHQYSGKVYYKCTLDGCTKFSEVSPQDTLIIEVLIQAVNAVDSMSAVQKWHFRVGEITIKEVNSELPQNSSLYMNSNGHSAIIPINPYDADINTLQISLKNGYIAKLNQTSSDFTWLYKTPTPIIDVWYASGKVHLLDPFAEKDDFFSIDSTDGKHTGLLFLGSYMNQLFVKQSKVLKRKVLFNHALTRPITYQAYCLPSQFKSNLPVLPSNDSNDLMVANLNGLDHGFYFYINFSVYDNDTHCIVNFHHPNSYEKFVEYSWFRICTGILVLLLPFAWALFKYLYPKKEFANECTSTTEIAITESAISQNQQFVSRFHKDFSFVTILGKGGFGMVVEAKNEIDDCMYAVKRIRFSSAEKCRKLEQDFVLREVKALAKLNHPGIVRYFNSWVEKPPKGWQENQDRNLNIQDISYHIENEAIPLPNSSNVNSENSNVSEKSSGILKKLRHNPLNPFPELSFDPQASTSGMQFGFQQQWSSSYSSSSSSSGKSLVSNDEKPSTSDVQPLDVQLTQSFSNVTRGFSLSNNEVLDSDIDFQSSSSGVQFMDMQQSASNSADVFLVSNSSSNLTSTEKENWDPRKNYYVQVLSRWPQVVTISIQKRNESDESGDNFYLPMFHFPEVNSDDDSENVEFMNEYCQMNSSDSYFGNPNLTAENVFLHLVYINESLEWKMNFFYLDMLRPFLLDEQWNWLNWQSILRYIPFSVTNETLALFQIWLIDVGKIVKSAISRYHFVLLSNMYNIHREVKNLLIVEEFEKESNRLQTRGDTYLNQGNINFPLENSELVERSRQLTVLQASGTAADEEEYSFLYIQMQLCQRENLRNWLDSHTGIRDYSEIMGIFFQIVDAIVYVHAKGLMHRDLKPSNIYFSLEGSIKIGDFGLATHFAQICDSDSSSELYDHTCHCGTELYMSPEQQSKRRYDSKTDIFSLGIILYELLNPFKTESERYKAIVSVRNWEFLQDFINNHPNECMLIRKLLDDDPNERPTALEIKNHPLFLPFN